MFIQSYGHYWLFQKFLRIVIQENSKTPKRGYMKNSNTHKMIPIVALWLVCSQSYCHSWLFFRTFWEFLFKKIPKFQSLSMRSYGNSNTHKMTPKLLPSLQLAKVMPIPQFEIWVLQNFCIFFFFKSEFATFWQ
jgi:hypothetical protein